MTGILVGILALIFLKWMDQTQCVKFQPLNKLCCHEICKTI